MSIITLLGFVLCGILLGAGVVYVAYTTSNPNIEKHLYDEIYQLETWNLHWKRECERMHHELVRANGSHSCKYCDPKKKNSVD